jgi:hypothetical protein
MLFHMVISKEVSNREESYSCELKWKYQMNVDPWDEKQKNIEWT